MMNNDPRTTPPKFVSEVRRVWKRNALLLSDRICDFNLQLPSLTVDWNPNLPETSLVFGTRAAENEQNRLFLARVRLLNKPGYALPNETNILHTQVKYVQEIKHHGVVNRARYMPQNPRVIATKTGGTEIFIFDCTRHPQYPYREEGVCNPELRLTGHNDKGYALSWSLFKQGHLLSGSDDGKICIWDINAPAVNSRLEAMRTFDIRAGPVEDVAWHMKNENLFGSVGVDKYLHIRDIRTPATMPNQSVLAHEAKVSSLAFNPNNGWVVATGSFDRKVKVFDLRNISSALHILEWGPSQKEVAHVRWNHMHEKLLASGCAGRRIVVWDYNRIGSAQTNEEAVYGPPELLFLNGGFANSRITDFSWSRSYRWIIATASTDNNLQLWQMEGSRTELSAADLHLPPWCVYDAPS